MFWATFLLSSANAVKLDRAEILSFSKELRPFIENVPIIHVSRAVGV